MVLNEMHHRFNLKCLGPIADKRAPITYGLSVLSQLLEIEGAF
jgi:hypothetical protein